MIFFKQFLIALLTIFLLSVPYAVMAIEINEGDVGAAQKSLNEKLENRPAVFRKNKGQWEDKILFRTQYENTNIYFTEKGLSFGLRKMWREDNLNADGSIAVREEAPPKFEYLVWDLNHINSNPNSYWEEEGVVKSNVNYFTNSNGDKPVLGSYDYNKIVNKDVYQNTDVQYYIQDNKLKYDYILKPKGNIGNIKLQFDGIDQVNINKNGELVIHTKWGKFKKQIPYSYQNINGEEVEVKVEFALLDDVVNGYTYRIIGDYDRSRDLVIDPVYIDWGSYFYGGGESQSQWTWTWTWVRDVDVDEKNYVYITGMTTDKFPTDPGWYDTSFNGNYDGFICKMKFDGTDIEWFSYIGGANNDFMVSITVTEAGEVFAIGTSSSTDFPITSNAYDKKNKNTSSSWWYGGTYVLLSLNTQGTTLKYSTFLNTGTTSNNYYYSWWLYNYPIEVNEKGEVFVALNYQVGSLTLPVKSYLLPQGFYTGSTFANSASIILKMNADGSDILNSTLFGGAGNDAIFGLYLNDTGLLYIGSSTTSANIPATKGVPGFGTLPVGGGDGHIAIMDTGFTKFTVSKYIGGKGDDKIVALYGSDDGIYMLLETTSSDILGYPNTAGGGIDAAVIKIRPDGIKAIWGTFLGGSNREIPKGITANIREEVILVGQSYSNNYPVTYDAFKKQAGSNWNWAYNGFLTKLNYDGNIIYSTYIGGSGVDFLMGVTTKRIGCVTHIVVGGYTTSTDFHVTKGAWRDSARKVNQNGWWYGGAILKLRDTLRLSKINLGGTRILCNDVYVRLDAENIGAEYKWSTGDSTRRIIALDSGTYWVNATYGCGYESDTTHLRLARSPTHVLPKDTVYCTQIYDTLDAINDTIPEVSYLWSTNDTTQRIIIRDSGLYKVIVATKSCGTIKDEIYIGLREKPEVTLPADSLFCSTVSLDLKSNFTDEDVRYKWSTGDTVQGITALDTGFYQVITSSYCGSDTAGIYLMIDTVPAFTMPQDSMFCDTVNLVLSPGTFSDYTNMTYSNNYFDVRSFNGLDYFDIRDTGSYWIELKNKCGTAKEEINITKLLTPSIYLPDYDTICDFGTRDLSIGITDNDESYLWLPDNSNSNSFTISKAGKYIGQISNKCGSVKDSIVVVYYISPNVFLGEDSIFCESVNHTLSVGLGGNNESYIWNNQLGSNEYNVTSAGTYNVELSNYCGTVRDTVSYGLLLLPEVGLGDDKIFCGDAFLSQALDAGNNNREEDYLWSTTEKVQTINTNTPGLYEVTVSNKCGSVSDEIEIVLSPYPIVELGLDTNFCGYFGYELDAGNPGDYYSWSPSGETSQRIVAEEYGTHEVTVRDQYGCESKDQVYITQKCSTLFFMPNAFTPNGNDRNEVFKPVLNDIFEFQFNVYNRWGELIFSTTDINEGWDGTFNGVPCMQGMYLWTVDRLGVERREHSDGSVFLKR